MTIHSLAQAIRDARLERQLTQLALAERLGPDVSRSVVARLEQGRRVPSPDVLERIGLFLEIPRQYWEPFLDEDVQLLIEFEDALSELCGYVVSLEPLEAESGKAAQELVRRLFRGSPPPPPNQTFSTVNRCLVFYGVPPLSRQFFDRFLGASAFRSPKLFADAVRNYQKSAIRLFSTFQVAFSELNGTSDLSAMLAPLEKRVITSYQERSKWESIDFIPDERLPDLGYISAARVAKEHAERQALVTFLNELAGRIENEGRTVLHDFNQQRLRKMDSLLRKFGSRIEHGLLSPLFAPDPDVLWREAQALAPKAESEISRIDETQRIALKNLSHYLTADYLDVYVATSMRTDADFVSVNRFVGRLFSHVALDELNLRYFNPTQSWIEDRVAKGLVEALMLRRAAFTIYMAQKEDTFGKDSEASVSLGQGKPVIVFVPKLSIAEVGLDTEDLGRLSRSELLRLLSSLNLEAEIDETVDNEGIYSRIIEAKLQGAPDRCLAGAVKSLWADFDLMGEANRIEDEDVRREYRKWLDAVVKDNPGSSLGVVRDEVISILVATSARFERRAKVFREIHPLALQVILNSGVLNGILVVRSIESCARLLRKLIENDLDMELEVDENNYRLVETTTGSTIRVISRNRLLSQAFATYYTR